MEKVIMSKKKAEKVTETVDVETNVDAVEQPEVQTLSLQELDQLAQVIDLASGRGAFRGAELQTVGGLYNKLVSFLTMVKAQQEAAAEAQENESAEAGTGEA
jgi:hypothetical protein|tara:strand:+ start:353 stop:658 length:306 start_codon:yes stop_codon:yes gene_type:complete